MGITLVVARHCQTKLNAEDRIQGVSFDLPLTKVGVLQANMMTQKLYGMLNGQKLEVVITSPSKRAMQTALTIYPNADLKTDKRLLPYNVGTADGLKHSEIHSIMRYPNPIVYRNMEGMLGYLKRTKKVLQDILLEAEHSSVLVVTHEDVSAVFEKTLMKKSFMSVPNLGLKNGEFRIYDIENFSKTDIQKGNFSNLIVSKQESKDYTVESEEVIAM